MSQQDLTADMLTRIRNAVRNRTEHVNCINNKLNRGVAKVLKEEGYIQEYEVIEDARDGDPAREDVEPQPALEGTTHDSDRCPTARSLFVGARGGTGSRSGGRAAHGDVRLGGDAHDHA